MRRLVPFALVTLASLLPAALPQSAWAQESGSAATTDESELAFLRAYYREVGANDPSGALAQYDVLLARPLAASVAGRVHVGRLRCLRALGRHDEADAAFARIEREFAGDAAVLAAARSVARAAAAESDDVNELVRRELRDDAWRERVPRFGDRAVPALAALLRAADPETVRRAAESLVRIATDTSCGALVDAVNSGEMGYVDLAFTPDWTNTNGVFARFYPAAFGRRLDAMRDAALRGRLVDAAFDAFGARDWIGDFAVAHPVDTRRLLADPSAADRNTDRVVVACVVRGGELRQLALTHIRDASDRAYARLTSSDVLFSPPPEFVADTEALRLLADRVVRNSRERTSSVLVDALLADPETRALGLDRALQRNNLPSEDPSRDVLVRALGAGDWGPMPENEYLRLARLLSPAPTADEWQTMLPHVPAGGVSTLLRFLPNAPEFQEARRRSIEALLATPARDAALRALWDSRTGTAELIARVAPPFLDDPDADVRYAAAWLLATRHGKDGLDATPFGVAIARAVAARLTADDVPDALVPALFGLGEDATTALVEALDVNGRGVSRVLQIAAEDDAIEALAWRVLEAPPSTSEERESNYDSAARLVVRRGGAARVGRLLPLISAESPTLANEILAATKWAAVDAATAGRFLRAAIERCPAAVRFGPRPDGELGRELALLALVSSSPDAQIWGADLERTLQDPAATARLSELASSTDDRVRRIAHSALAAIRAAAEDLAWSRAATERAATRERVRTLIASANPRERMAGIAGIVALGAPDALERLLDVAAGDADADVAAEARRALLALRPDATPATKPAPASDAK